MLVTLALILFLAFASVAALLVRRYSRALRANEMELERARSAQLQYEAALRLSGTLVTEEIYSGLRELTARVMACDGMIVSSYDDEARTVRCVYLWVNGHQLDHTTLPVLPIDLEHGTGMQTEVIRTGEGRFFGDVQKRVTQGGRYYDVSGDGKVRDLSGPEAAPAMPRCSLMVPIKLEGKVVGVVQASSDTPGYTARHLAWLESLVAPMAVALQNAELYARASHEIAQRARAERALTESQERLRDADRRKNVFLATLAHELRNPLAPIRTAVELLGVEHAAGDQAAWCREVIERQVAHMARLLDDLLDVSRISRGMLRLRNEGIDLAEVIRHSIEASDPAIRAGGHALRVSLPPEPVLLHADATRLAQVVSNLLINSARYSDPGSRIELEAAREGEMALIRVRDNGMGISPEVLPHIFEPFVQGNRSLERSQGGLGIGLTLVKQVVELHGGTVSAASDGPGLGSEFVVRLPAVPLAEAMATLVPAAHPAAPGNGGPPTATVSGNGTVQVRPARRILVADDLKDSADSMARMLRADGHEVRTAYDGAEAVELAREFRPDIVLLDLGMPAMDGYEAARRIREECRSDDLVLVAIAGWGHDENRQRTREAGFDHHLVKPVEPAAIHELLAQPVPSREA